MIVPDGFALPPTPYLVTLLAGVAALAIVLFRIDPPFDARTVLATTPWMGIGGGLHVLYVLELAPASIAPFLGTPAVYVSTGILAGLVWVVALVGTDSVETILGAVGALGLLGVVAVVVGASSEVGGWWPAIAAVLSLLLTALIWGGIVRGLPRMAQVTTGSGIALVFGHVLDGVTTAVGIDVLQAGERSPVPRAIMAIAEYLPTAEALGVGWLFVLVKVVMAVGIAYLFVPFVEETERQGHVILALLAAVGLGPGVHNLLLFLAAG